MSDCGVCIGSEPDCMAEFYEVATVKARKSQVCNECGREIVKGTQYVRESGKWDGEFCSFKTCLLCVEIRSAFTCDEGNYAVCFGELWNDITENLFPNMNTGCLNKLKSAAAKQFLIDRWNEWKFGKLATETK